MWNKFLLAVMFFALGYFAHDFIAPRVAMVSLTPLTAAKTGTTSSSPNSRDVKIIYDGKRFIPASTSIERGRYLTVINESQSLMWLVSEDPQFVTPRGYGYKEQIKVRVNTPETIRIANKLDLGATATITVK